MIDGTEERESYALEGRFKFEIDTTKGLKLSALPGSKSKLWEGSFGNKLGYFEENIDWNGQRQLGPGGYDPLDVVNALPPQLQEAFKNRDYQMLNAALMQIPREEAEYYLNGCMEGGLWCQPKTLEQRLGPGGYDPFEVLNVLPPAIAEAMRSRKYDMLDAALNGFSAEEIQYHLRACVDSGLWVLPPPGGERLGPGGLDPMVILDTLPEAMYLAFKNQNVEQLNAALGSLPREEADYHLKRCIDSGLWAE